MSCLKLFGAFILVSLVSVCHGTLSRGLSLIDSNLFITDMMLEDVKNEVAAQSQSNVTACWKDSFDRGVGKPISACPPGDEKSGLLCYPFCDAGYTGVGPVCWEECKPGYTDTGTHP